MPSGVVSATYVAAQSHKPPWRRSALPRLRMLHQAAQRETVHCREWPTATTLQSVAITPSQPAVAIGSTTQLKAVATFNDGSVKDVTAEFGWQSSDTRTIAANASGVLSGLATGPATISGNYQGVQASVASKQRHR